MVHAQKTQIIKLEENMKKNFLHMLVLAMILGYDTKSPSNKSKNK